MNRQFLALLTAAAVSTAALVSVCGAAEEQTPEAAEQATEAPAEKAQASEEKAEETSSEEASAPAADGEFMAPFDRVKAAPKGTLKNPYTGNEEAIAEGQKLFMGLSCNGCHGGGGGGGMCPPLTNEVWVYGGDDDTLFRLITLGSNDLKAEGYSRKGTEGVVGPMMAYKDLIDDERKIWKIIAWIRTKWGGREERKEW